MTVHTGRGTGQRRERNAGGRRGCQRDCGSSGVARWSGEHADGQSEADARAQETERT